MNKIAIPWRQRRQTAWFFLSLLLVAAIGIVIYSNTFSVPFLLDDEPAIATNNITKEISRFFSGQGFQGFHYNPRRLIGYLSFALDYHYGGLDVTGYHVVNLTIHIASAFLVYALAAVTLKTPFFTQASPSAECKPLPPGSGLLPLVVALLFVAHPIQTQAVTYIVQRFTSLATLFYVAAIVCYAQGRIACSVGTHTQLAQTCRWLPLGTSCRWIVIVLWFFLSGFMSVLSMLTKEIAATLPLTIILYECCFFGITRKKLVRGVWIAAALAGGGIFLLVALRTDGLLAAIDSMTRETVSISRSTYFFTEITVVVTYLRLLILPIKQQVLYDYPLYHSIMDGRVLLSFFLLASLLTFSGWLYFRSGRIGKPPGEMLSPSVARSPDYRLLRIASFGVIWFFVTLSIESSIIPIIDVIFEHRLYLPSIGFFLAVVATAISFAGTRRIRVVATIAGIAVVILAIATYLRNETWRDPIKLWRDNVDKSPSNAGAWQSLGVSLSRIRDHNGAIQAYRRCLEINGDDPQILNNIGLAYAETGHFVEAMEMFRRSLQLAPDKWSTWLNLGGLYIRSGNYKEAENTIKSAIRLSPQRLIPHFQLGYLYELQGHYAEAEKKYREAIALDPSYSIAWKRLGKVYYATKRYREALEYTNRGNALERQGGDIYYGTSSSNSD
jgi:protein O-mannosyl-transferase